MTSGCSNLLADADALVLTNAAAVVAVDAVVVAVERKTKMHW